MIALDNYDSTNNSTSVAVKHLPTGCIGPGQIPEERLSWLVALLPYLEQKPLYDQFDLNKGYQANLPAAGTKIRLFVCPTAKDAGTAGAVTYYVAMSGIGLDAATQPSGVAGNGFMGYDRLTSWNDIRDGSANTIALMEARFGIGPWAQGGPSTLRGFDPSLSLHGEQRPFGWHDKVMQAAMADGSVRMIRTTIDAKMLAAAITIAGKEPVDLD